MKKIIQISLVLLILMIITVGYTSGYGAGEKSVSAYAAAQDGTGTLKEAAMENAPADRQYAVEPDKIANDNKTTDDSKIIDDKKLTGGNNSKVNNNVKDSDKIKDSNKIKAGSGRKDIPASGMADPGKPMVALTFDDGPHPKYTAEIVEALKKNDARATFFVLGSRAEKYKSTINTIVKNGNEIGNHTYSHRELTRLKKPEIQSEIKKTSDILEAITGKAPFLTRPTYGSVNENVKTCAGSPLILWSVDTLDWKRRDKEKIVQRTLNTVKDGDIILMHDIYKSTADAAKVVISELRARGYQLVTISQLYQARDISLENGKEYFECSTYYAGNNKK